MLQSQSGGGGGGGAINYKKVHAQKKLSKVINLSLVRPVARGPPAIQKGRPSPGLYSPFQQKNSGSCHDAIMLHINLHVHENKL